MLGLAGTSIIVASGDGGVGGPDPDPKCTNFVAVFPSVCPYVTSVGSTSGISPESASGFTSGGFSNVVSAPSYQQTAIAEYLTTIGNLNAGKFNRLGRGFPDVSVHGQDVLAVVSGRTGLVAGSEASVSVFASIIALINDALIANGKRSLGFLNPMLYSLLNENVFNDITSGTSVIVYVDKFSLTLFTR